jgi:hypothetical protein
MLDLQPPVLLTKNLEGNALVGLEYHGMIRARSLSDVHSRYLNDDPLGIVD